MNNQLSKTVRLSGGALAAAKLYKTRLEQAREEWQEEHDKAAQKLAALHELQLEGLKSVWMTLASQIFDSEEAEKSWNNSNYRLDATYLDHDVAFVNVFGPPSQEDSNLPKPTVDFSGGMIQ